MTDEKTALDYLVRKPHPMDETPAPAWGIGPDGKHTPIGGDERFLGLFNEWLADACQHDRVGIIRWVNGGGQTCFNWFCGDCGHKLSSNIPHALANTHGVKNTHLDSMASRSNVYFNERRARLEELARAAAERCQPGNREEYGDYLRSPRWRALRDKVLRRATGVCEGCLDAPAIDVHHLSYAHKGDEFAFELRALCRSCHDRWHTLEAAA